ncbi:hypothetical protein BDV96DRAFT_627772 [Lophiotrema nucula]|uniref:Uncharacterized protein n=1 Tax=Lophiotrema nucula TaxID=690887 RepID=A0A6A5ZQL8_9PLEO|nr:hypothetical protein BDV96DRAFT_627772 [Lophiotrema nucula]
MSNQVKLSTRPPTGKLSSEQRMHYYKTALKDIRACLPKLDKDRFKQPNTSNLTKIVKAPVLEYRLLVGGTKDGQYQVHICLSGDGYNNVIFLRGNTMMPYKDVSEIAFDKPFVYVNKGNATTTAGQAQVEALALCYFMSFLKSIGRDRTVDVTTKFWTNVEAGCGHVGKAERKRQLENPDKHLGGPALKRPAKRERRPAPIEVLDVIKTPATVSKTDQSTQVDLDFLPKNGKRMLGTLDISIDIENSSKRHKTGAKPTSLDPELQIKHLTQAFALRPQEVDNAKSDLEQGRAGAIALLNAKTSENLSLEMKVSNLQRQCDAKNHQLGGLIAQVRDLQGGHKKEMMKALELDEKCALLQTQLEEKDKRIAELEGKVGDMKTKAVMARGFTRDVLEVVRKYSTGMKVEN